MVYLNIPAVQEWMAQRNQPVPTVQEAWDRIILCLEDFTASIAAGSRKHTFNRCFQVNTDDNATLIAKFQF
jgi:hypothetical protein